ncbi:MAG: nicotinate-nucleotide--dimethylbenzimidazole phosphoribosyltransferase [Desulfobacterales bacterium]|nr:MAG: nicotinate-nucleotide--dimethylbenzimidazole phosphoribosyltransferase [Desulfobacterales bacterium]
MIQMVLNGLGDMELRPLPAMAPGPGEVLVDVLACAICRTDAKMWEQGHRDLVFPRVLGHEMIVRDQQGNRFIVWPGANCGTCNYCRSGKENLCDDMKITGFHHDGGFAHRAVLPKASLIPVPDTLNPHVACFAEPVGCVVNAFEKLAITPGRRILIFGGGTMGLITAIYAKSLGLAPFILEKNAAKIKRISPILETEALACGNDTHDSLFDIVINACPDYIALCQAVSKVNKGGQISFFSGISKNETVETNLLNLLHYKEVVISGAYGMRKSDMAQAIPFLMAHSDVLTRLIEDVVSPAQALTLLPQVLKGQSLKYILDFTGKRTGIETAPKATVEPASDPADTTAGILSKSPLISTTLNAVTPPAGQEPEAQAKMDNKTKPLGALGKLEALGIQMAVIQNTLNPSIKRKAMLVFAGDHGVTEEGVSAFPKEVTGQMVDNFLSGGAAINVLCRCHGIEMKVVDMGVDKEFFPHPDLIRSKVAKGTRNMALEPAMSKSQAVAALENGVNAFLSLCKIEPLHPAPQILGLGEMGIGNTTSASAIISAVTGISPVKSAGRGTGVDNKGLSHKAKVIERILNFHAPSPEDGFEILRTVGGFELAGIAGAAIAAASHGCAVVLDGVISTAAGLIAYLICPDIQGYLISGHKSVESAQAAALAYMGLEPIVDLKMRLGEGTGAALTINLVESACCIMTDMASFEDAKISKSPS